MAVVICDIATLNVGVGGCLDVMIIIYWIAPSFRGTMFVNFGTKFSKIMHHKNLE